MTSQERKKIIEMKNMKPFHDGRLSRALYMMNTQPSWDAATYTVKNDVAIIYTLVSLVVVTTTTTTTTPSLPGTLPRRL